MLSEKEIKFVSLCQSSFPSNAIKLWFKNSLFLQFNLVFYHGSFCGSEQQIIYKSFITRIHTI